MKQVAIEGIERECADIQEILANRRKHNPEDKDAQVTHYTVMAAAAQLIKTIEELPEEDLRQAVESVEDIRQELEATITPEQAREWQEAISRHEGKERRHSFLTKFEKHDLEKDRNSP